MKCPVCRDPDLTMADRQGIEIDYCPRCRGVWLDRGELDKLIERVATQIPADRPDTQRMSERYRPEYRRDDDDDYDRGHPRRGRGFLGDFFDFD